MKIQKTLIAALALALTFGTLSMSSAQETTPHHQGEMATNQQMMQGNMMDMGQMNHCNMAKDGHMATLTPEQQQEVNAIEAKYATEKTALETAMTDKRATMHTAMNTDTTTIGSMKGMRQEMIALHQDWQALRQKINQEISTKTGITYAASTQEHPMQQGNMMQMSQMMEGNSMGQQRDHCGMQMM